MTTSAEVSGVVPVTHHRTRKIDGVADLSRIAPDNWVHDQALLDRPGNADIQMDLFYDYRTNLPLYPACRLTYAIANHRH